MNRVEIEVPFESLIGSDGLHDVHGNCCTVQSSLQSTEDLSRSFEKLEQQVGIPKPLIRLDCGNDAGNGGHFVVTAQNMHQFDLFRFCATDSPISPRYRLIDGAFVHGAPILMSDGTARPVQEIVVDDEVVVWNAIGGAWQTANARVLAVSESKVNEYAVLTLSSGRKIQVSKVQRLLNRDRRWCSVEASHMPPGDVSHVHGGVDGDDYRITVLHEGGLICSAVESVETVFTGDQDVLAT